MTRDHNSIHKVSVGLKMMMPSLSKVKYAVSMIQTTLNPLRVSSGGHRSMIQKTKMNLDPITKMKKTCLPEVMKMVGLPIIDPRVPRWLQLTMKLI